MKNPGIELKKIRQFLESIPLSQYREETKGIKWVEQDLPKAVLPLASIFQFYWKDRNFVSFEEWFENFWQEINSNSISKKALEKFKQYYFNRSLNENDWFKKGFKARMYRTWVSLLTQLDFCYMLDYVCAKKGKNFTIVCSAELDMKGIDAQVDDICFQIAKISERKEARPGRTKRRIIPIPYAVFNLEELNRRLRSERTKNKEKIKKMLNAFNKYFLVLQNGFVVFKESYIEKIVEHMGDYYKLKEIVYQVYLELLGE
ncbi:TaqI family restriction endonuclease [bacterium]|nr:TaqI family restriction endonuclease [bacterium]